MLSLNCLSMPQWVRLRSQLNLSQEKFAAQLGVSFKTVNRWENAHTLPSPMALKLLKDLSGQIEAEQPRCPLD